MVDRAHEPGCATHLLNRLGAGDASVEPALVDLVYAELKCLAARHTAHQPARNALQPTELVHEAWLRLVQQNDARYDTRRSFFALASRVMRNLLVDHARAQAVRERDEIGLRVTLDRALDDGLHASDFDLLALNEALEALGHADGELQRIVELRFFGGLTSLEAAEVLDLPLRSYERRFQVARIWLHRHLNEGLRGESASSSSRS